MLIFFISISSKKLHPFPHYTCCYFFDNKLCKEILTRNYLLSKYYSQCNFDFSFLHGYVSWTCFFYNCWLLNILWELNVQLIIWHIVLIFIGRSLTYFLFVWLLILITYHLNKILKYFIIFKTFIHFKIKYFSV